MFTDLRFVFRTLFRNRTFTLVTVFTLALGIGAAAAIFSVADYVLFRANKFPDRVYLVGGRTDTGALMPVRFDYMMRAYEQTTAMDEYGKAAFVAGNIVIKGQPVATSWLGVSPNLFNMLGVTPALGRGFLPGEGKDGADNVVIVSDHFWHGREWDIDVTAWRREAEPLDLRLELLPWRRATGVWVDPSVRDIPDGLEITAVDLVDVARVALEVTDL